MKKIAVVAANGKAGRLIVKEAVERGMDVTAFARSENKTSAEKFVQADIMDLTRQYLELKRDLDARMEEWASL